MANLNMVSTLSYKKITIFWLPLASTWLMMALEGPFLAAVIARLPDAKFNLAAYGVAFSFALIIEAPIIMIMSASTALVNNSQRYLKLKSFTFRLNSIITCAMFFFLIPQIFDLIAKDIIGLPEKVASLTYISTWFMLPWPGAIGIRRFYQGVMIRLNYTRRVAYGTLIRLVTMAGTAFGLFYNGSIPGAYVGALSLTAGVLIEAIFSRIMVHSIVRKIKTDTMSLEPSDILTYRNIIKFYYPLALTSTLGLAVQPIVTFFMGQSLMALESLAVLPVVNSLVFIFRSMGLSYQEVGIALMGKRGEGFKELRNFAIILAISASVMLSLIAFSPLADLWFGQISGLSNELAGFAVLPTKILALIPGLAVLLAFQRSIMVTANDTRPITGATITEVLIITLILAVSILYLNSPGAVGAAWALILGRLGGNIYLFLPNSKAVGKLLDN